MQEIVAANWRSLIRPKRVEAKKSTDTYGKFVVRPLERGFGITLGNALRRILLSSLQGAAIKTVKIEGVLHEFSSIPGVVDDVTNIVLNLKQVRIRTSSNEVLNGHIDKTCGEGETVDVTAGDIRFDGEAEVLNPDLVVATLIEGGRFQAEVTAAMGRGFVLGAMTEETESHIGVPVDALRTNQKVKYTVTSARVGHRTDFDQLTLEVWTDGSVSLRMPWPTPPRSPRARSKSSSTSLKSQSPSCRETAPEEEWNKELSPPFQAGR